MPLTLRAHPSDVDGDTYVVPSVARGLAASRGWAFPSDDAEAERAILRATDYLDARYVFALALENVPPKLELASVYLASKAATEPLEIAPTQGLASGGTAGGQVVEETAESAVGPLRESSTTRYAPPTAGTQANTGNEGQWRVFPLVEGWLKPFLTRTLDHAAPSAAVVSAVRT